MSKEEGPSIKKALSSLDVAVITEELRKYVTNSYIDNVYKEVDCSHLLRLRTASEDLYLLVKPGERLYLTKHIRELSSGGRVPLFRRFIRGLMISDIVQVEFERIVKLTLTGRDLRYYMYIELIPRGVMVVTDPEGKILVSSGELRVKDREVVAGTHYSPPPMFKNFRVLDVDEWFNTVSEYGNLARGLIRGLGIPPEVVNEVLGSGSYGSDISRDTVAKLREEIIGFITRVISNPDPVIVTDLEGRYVTFLAFRPLRTYSRLRLLGFSSLNEAADEYFLKYDGLLMTSQQSKSIESEISRVSKLLGELEGELANLRKGLGELKEVHDLVVSNYRTIEEVYNCVRNAVKSYGWEHVVKCGVLSYNSNTGSFRIMVNDVPLELSVRESPKDYVISLKKRISDYENSIRRVEEVINKLVRKKDELLLEKRLLEVPPLSRRVDWYDKYHWIVTSDGLLAIGGRDAEQNEKLVKKYLRDEDIFIHADIRGAPVFVLKCNGRVLERSISEVSVLAVCYSRGWREGLAALDAFWVFGSQVSKGPPAGEYLMRGSFMTYGKKNYIRDVRLELAIGVAIYEDLFYKLVVGPEDLISSRCRFYAILRPGSNGKESVAKSLLKFFTDCDRRLRYLNVNEVISRIPGPSLIVRYVKNA